MAIITISRGSYSKGSQVAEAVAARLGFECVSRDVLLEASDRFNVPEVKLMRAIHDAPSMLDKVTHGKLDYVTYVKCALAERIKKDNVVYHGLAGHLLLRGIRQVLKVRIIADMSARIAHVVATEKCTEQEARDLIGRVDEDRRKWARWLYDVDPDDPSLYDLVIHIGVLDVEDAVDLICRASAKEPFKTSERARQRLQDFALACLVKALLLETDHDVRVRSKYGNVLVFTKADDRRARRLEEKARSLCDDHEEIHNIEVHAGDRVPPEAV